MSRIPYRKLLLVALIHTVSFSYFIQGGGWNQTATIGEIRAIAERGTFDLGEYAQITGDRSYYKEKILSNKTPNMTFFVAPLYYFFYRAAKTIWIDTDSETYQFVASHLITFLCAGLWGVLFGLLLFFILGELFRLRENDKIIVALLTPLSTMLFPFATMAFVHMFEAFWYLLFCFLFIKFLKNRARYKQTILLGLSLGVCVLANFLLALTSPIILWNLLIQKHKRWKNILIFSAMVCVPLILLFVYNVINFDDPLKFNRNFQDPLFTKSYKFLGVFGPPHLERIFYVLFWSYRSLTPTQIYLLLFIPGLFLFVNGTKLRKRLMWLFTVTILIYFLFIASFYGWHGGNIFGPRYICPLLAIFLIWSIPIYQRFKKLYVVLMAVSFVMIFIMTSVNPQCCDITVRSPFFEYGLPNFLKGNLALYPGELFTSADVHDFSFNLGHLFGLKGLWSLVPLIAFQSMLGFFLYRLCRKSDSY